MDTLKWQEIGEICVELHQMQAYLLFDRRRMSFKKMAASIDFAAQPPYLFLFLVVSYI